MRCQEKVSRLNENHMQMLADVAQAWALPQGLRRERLGLRERRKNVLGRSATLTAPSSWIHWGSKEKYEEGGEEKKRKDSTVVMTQAVHCTTLGTTRRCCSTWQSNYLLGFCFVLGTLLWSDVAYSSTQWPIALGRTWGWEVERAKWSRSLLRYPDRGVS